MARAMVDLLHRAKAAALVIEGNSLPSSNTRLDIGRPHIDGLSEVVANTRKGHFLAEMGCVRVERYMTVELACELVITWHFLLLSTSIFATFLLHM
nr:MAG TPA: hypothetical protein [Bacteriophage sp.]